ncbi:hypothetical protein SPI_06799 [Niveomyces insectorum RCEF 264]|uniref:N-acetylgalactosaminide beta-1,3-galactosyltransferase n=1 Tax=Niveomyces insectorum RCEF 264 TaxID=1081102 RepID=A0A167QS17_9HYPO|nr:hypothetical protein SPI_06799 [Niveomyces insectorum RCEF 264]
MPHKAWYLLLDDDTFVVPASLRRLLAHLDPAAPHYLGNAVGDYRARFAHGGSAIVLSQGALRRLFGRADVDPDRGVAAPVSPLLYVASVTETWGDRLLATTLLQVGVYLDERFVRLFNGARPRATRISTDRVCLPLVSFHGLAQPAEMAETGRVFARLGRYDQHRHPQPLAPVLAWGDLWALYGRPTLAALQRQPVWPGADFVGRPGDDSSSAALVTRRTDDVVTAASCRRLCMGDDVGGEDEDEDGGNGGNSPPRPRWPRRPAGNGGGGSSNCLAWTWNATAQACLTSPWFVVGEDDDVRRMPPSSAPPPPSPIIYSGINVALMRQFVDRCSQRDGVAWTEEDGVYGFLYDRKP